MISQDICLHLTFSANWNKRGKVKKKKKKREFIFKVMFSLLSQWSMLKLAFISTHAAML